jgi:hypothetical protein
MPDRTIRSILILSALSLVTATIGFAQSPTSSEVRVNPTHDDWQAAQRAGASQGRLVVVTLDHPDRRQSCRVQSFTAQKLVCSRGVGGPRTYLPQQVLALILPGDQKSKIPWVLGFNAGLGAAIWGTVVLAAACPACAVATGIAALLFFAAAGAVLIGDDQPDRLLYLARGQELSKKLGYVQS